MKLRNFLHITVCSMLLLAFIGIPVTKSYCNMEFCSKECYSKCCVPDSEKNGCEETTQYLQIDSDFSYTDASVKIPDISLLLYTVFLNFPENPVTVLQHKHSEFLYPIPFITHDIPVEVRCFRI